MNCRYRGPKTFPQRQMRLDAVNTQAGSEANACCPLARVTPLFLAAAAGGAAAFADVAAAGRAHLGTAGQAQRGVRSAALLRLDQLGGAVRLVWLGGPGRLRRFPGP